MNTEKQFTECPTAKGCHPFTNYGIGRKKLFIHIRVIENVNNRIEKEIIRTLDNFSRYLFLACLISTPIFLIYNLIKL